MRIRIHNTDAKNYVGDFTLSASSLVGTVARYPGRFVSSTFEWKWWLPAHQLRYSFILGKII
jgi:hypothetical protein